MSSSASTDHDTTGGIGWSPTVFKAVLLSFVLLAIAIPLLLAGLPFIEFFNGMAAQPKGKTQMTYGRVYHVSTPVGRLPVEGTVPLEYFSYDYDTFGATLDDAKKVGELLQNPMPRTMANMQRGQELFDIYCIVCHGRQGEGDGPIIGPDRFPAPPSLHTDQARGYADGTIFHLITKGTEKMPSYRDKLTPDERWQVIHYVRALQRAMNPDPEDLQP